ncbi:MAG TPA: hypothetical protein PLL60_04375, partial [Bacilli bacterium]|nr:hypothetical protein [Bacilli bacterium]
PLIRTTETAIAMMTDNTMFDSAEMHDPIVGLGDDAMFAEMVTPEMKQAIKEGKSNFDALFAAHGSDSLNTFITAGQQAIDQMFAAMKDGEVGVGVFHDPTIPLMGWAHGLQEVRSLDSMQAIVFTMNDDGSITARWQ